MIQFQPDISWIYAFLLSGLILCLLGFVGFKTWNSNLSANRKLLRISLNAVLSLFLIGLIFQPVWEVTKATEPTLVFPKEMKKDRIQFWKDSLGIQKAGRIDQLKPESNPVYLVGTDYSSEQLHQISDRQVQMIPENKVEEFEFLDWKGILRQGEIQKIQGSIQVGSPTEISIRLGEEILDQVTLEQGIKEFELTFAAKIEGRNELILSLNGVQKAKIRFFTQATQPKKYSLNFSFPDLETRLLSQYLRNQGELVSEEIQVSRDTRIQTSGNRKDTLEVLITEPSQVSGRTVKEAIAKGSQVIFIQTAEPEKSVQAINRALKTDFSILQTGSENRVLENGGEALPFRFESGFGKNLLLEESVAIQQIGNSQIGLSLLGPSFPIALAGDSLLYGRIWDEILGAMYPAEAQNWELNAPVFSGFPSGILLNQKDGEANSISLGSDTVFLSPSLINPQTSSGEFIASETGWISLGDSLEVFVYTQNELKNIFQNRMIHDFLKSGNQNNQRIDLITKEQKVPDWLWLAAILIVMTLVWLEPRWD
ncbi:MAG: hypothetical protein PSV36_11570 [Algoriphagus sp.]|nr:hypothetical protein [Algoriphagus sp.]